MSIKSVADLISLGSGLIAVGGALWVGWLYSIKVKAFFEKLLDSHALLTQMSKEFAPNGGSTMKDAVNVILSRLETIEGNQSVFVAMDRMLASVDRPAGVFQADHFGDVVWVSPTWVDLSGLTQDDSQGSGWINAVTAPQRAAVEAAWKAAQGDERALIMACTLEHITAGVMTVCRLLVSPATTANGHVMGWVGVAIPLIPPRPGVPVLPKLEAL